MENLRDPGLPARMLEIRVTLSGAGYWTFSHTLPMPRFSALLSNTTVPVIFHAFSSDRSSFTSSVVTTLHPRAVALPFD